MEQPPDKAGTGWLFIAAAFPDGKWPFWTQGLANGQPTCSQRSDFGATVTLLEEQVMLTPWSETNLSQRRRTRYLASKYLLRTQRDFSHNFHRIWVQHQRIKVSNATPLLIVWWSYDSIKRRRRTKQMLRLHFVFNLFGRSHFPRTNTEPIASLQQFLRGHSCYHNLRW